MVETKKVDTKRFFTLKKIRNVNIRKRGTTLLKLFPIPKKNRAETKKRSAKM